MSRSITFGAIAMVATGILPLPLGAAQAQSAADTETRPAIVVTAPHARQTGRSTTGAPILMMEAQSVVYFDDLNLATEAGKDELNDRVAAAAESACDWLYEVFPPGPTTAPPSECQREAIQRADSQIDAVIARGG